MKKFKMPSKQEIADAVKFFLMICTSTLGFLFVYLMIIVRLEIPAWWSIIALVLAFASEFGLCAWIVKEV